MPLRQCAPDLFAFTDGSCNVYVIRRGDRAILIDGAGGEVLDELRTIGVEAVDWVLFTHHHRDQCHGAAHFVETGARLAVPWHERDLFESVEAYWQQKRIYDNYNDRSTFFSLASSVPVVGDLGHGTLAFTGDLICQVGQLYQLHAMEYEYGDLAGVHWTSTALDQLRKRQPQQLLPGHGALIEDAAGDMARLDARLHRLLEHTPYRSAPAPDLGLGLQFAHETPMVQLSEHLLWGEEVTCSNFYVIRADSGKALFIDYPYYSNGLFPTALHHGEPNFSLRFIEHHLDELRTEWGVTQIDVVIPTHIHDDHVCGIPFLQRHCDTRVGRWTASPRSWRRRQTGTRPAC